MYTIFNLQSHWQTDTNLRISSSVVDQRLFVSGNKRYDRWCFHAQYEYQHAWNVAENEESHFSAIFGAERCEKKKSIIIIIPVDIKAYRTNAD